MTLWNAKHHMRLRLVALLALFALLVAACGQPSAGGTTEASTAASTGGEAAASAETEAAPSAAESAAGEASAAAETGGDASELMTVSTQQQATWVRNFNPFVADFRWPTRNGVYEPLMVFNSIKSELTPWLATEYAWSDDNKTLTWTIQEGITWSDGQPFTANDVAYTLNLYLENTALQGGPPTPGEYIEKVEATDDKTVVVTFKTVNTLALYDIAATNIVPEHIWKDVDDPIKFANETPVGTGPFTEVSNFQNQIYEVRKNPNYWQEGKPYIEGFRFPAYPGNDQANLATTNGENDWAGNFIPDIQKIFVDKNPENYGYWFPATGATIMLYTNTTKAPFDNVDVRKAISMAINRDQIVQVAMYDYTHPADATGLSDAFTTWKDQAIVDAGAWTKLDVAKANEMLDAAGLARGSDGTRTLPDGTPMTYDINVVSGWTDWVQACQIMAQNLKEVGINATVKTYDFSAWLERVQAGNFDLSIGWSSGGATPYNYYRGQMSQQTAKPVGEAGAENWHRFVSPEADELLQQFTATSDPEEQKQIGVELQKVFDANAPAIPLFPGPQWYQFNTERFTDFPNEENQYALGSPFSAPDQLVVMTTVKPK